ncbi:hypothetical protein [Cupriavidus pampae]|uniref:Phage tail protein n=1 Tax=Cupriavidus pampae TaxID=659251 RepID=A0ABM8XCF1_9BURK|nr:hypothetical protein [Cupriavidus pampae]CAG9177770.1 hypothetical protein LMG32289_03901 [Cupriavidus pampae]
MSKQTIALGTPPTGSDGDTSRVAFGKSNNNFDELYKRAQSQLDKSIAGAAGVVTLTALEALNGCINLSGLITGDKEVVLPADVTQMWVVRNSTTGNFRVLVRSASGIGVVLQQGTSDILLADGAGILSATTGVAAAAKQPVRRNLFRNAQWKINQRGYVSGTATTSALQNTYDGWRVVVSGQAVILNGDTATAPAGGMEQVVEAADLDAGSYVMTWEGSAVGFVGTTQVVSGSPFTLNGGGNVNFRFANGFVRRPALSRGTSALPFEPREFASDLAICKRYTNLLYDIGATVPFASGIAVDVNNAVAYIPIPEMYATPTGFILSGSAIAQTNVGAIGLAQATGRSKSVASLVFSTTATMSVWSAVFASSQAAGFKFLLVAEPT